MLPHLILLPLLAFIVPMQLFAPGCLLHCRLAAQACKRKEERPTSGCYCASVPRISPRSGCCYPNIRIRLKSTINVTLAAGGWLASAGSDCIPLLMGCSVALVMVAFFERRKDQSFGNTTRHHSKHTWKRIVMRQSSASQDPRRSAPRTTLSPLTAHQTSRPSQPRARISQTAQDPRYVSEVVSVLGDLAKP